VKTVKFLDLHGQGHVEVVDIAMGSAPCKHEHCDQRGGWHAGDEKPLSDDQAAIILSNPNFVEVEPPKPTSPATSAKSAPTAPAPSRSLASDAEEN
jgi:hypothetical protein